MGKVEAMKDSDYDIGRTGDNKTPNGSSLFDKVKKLK
jgi:ribonucleoside-diphosphate reductase beta chain